MSAPVRPPSMSMRLRMTTNVAPERAIPLRFRTHRRGGNVPWLYRAALPEEYAIWPPHAGAAEGEAPGRIGKRAACVSFAAASWPSLAPLANDEGGVNIVVDEAKVRETMRNA